MKAKQDDGQVEKNHEAPQNHISVQQSERKPPHITWKSEQETVSVVDPVKEHTGPVEDYTRKSKGNGKALHRDKKSQENTGKNETAKKAISSTGAHAKEIEFKDVLNIAENHVTNPEENSSRVLGIDTKASDGTQDDREVGDTKISTNDSQAPHDTKASEQDQKPRTKKRKKRRRKHRQRRGDKDDQKDPHRKRLVGPETSDSRPSAPSSLALPPTISITSSSSKSIGVDTLTSTGTSEGSGTSGERRQEGESTKPSTPMLTENMVRTVLSRKKYSDISERGSRVRFWRMF